MKDQLNIFVRNLFVLVVGLLGIWVLVSILNKFVPMPIWLGALLKVLYAFPVIWLVTRYVPYYRAVTAVALGVALMAASFHAYDLYMAQDPLLTQDAQQGQRARWNFIGWLIGSTKANQEAVGRRYANDADREIAKKMSEDHEKSIEVYRQNGDLSAFVKREEAIKVKYTIAEKLSSPSPRSAYVSNGSELLGDTITYSGNAPLRIGVLQPGMGVTLTYLGGHIISNASNGFSSPICGTPLSQTLDVWKRDLPYRKEGMNTDAVYLQLSGGLHKAFPCTGGALEITNSTKEPQVVVLNMHDAYPTDNKGDAKFRLAVH